MEFNNLLKLIADENRSKIILLLKHGEVCVCNLAEQLAIEQSLLSHHLQKLKQADLVIERKVGRWVHYSLNQIRFLELEQEFQNNFSMQGIREKPCDLHNQGCK
ncbi:MAG: metalloregulator ArsR/SmtB family transcription factor [bacterium]